MHLQDLLKNSQMVDKTFAFCPINPDGTDKKIHEISGIVTNMTMLGAHFKISSNGKTPLRSRNNGGKLRRTRRSSGIGLFIFR